MGSVLPARMADSNIGESAVELLAYRRAPLLPSDHKPVTAVLKLNVRRIDPEREAKVRQDIIHTLDR